MSNTVKLGEEVLINPESVSKNYPYDEIEYIDISSVGSGTFEGARTVPIKDAPSRAKRLVKNGDTIISTVRPNRRSFLYIKNPKSNTVVSTGFAVLRAKDNIDERYLYFMINYQAFTDYLTNRAKGAAYPAVDTEIISNAKIPLPPLSTQKNIASILSAYDDLIENNTRRIQILEEMAQRIYKEWFVDFKYPGYEDDQMIDSELGKIPDGWEVLPLNEIIDIKSGFAFKSSSFESDGSYGLVTIKNVQDGIFITKCQNHLNETPDKMPEYCILRGGDIILSLTGNVGRVCLVHGEKYLLNQRVAKLIPNNIADRAFVYSLFRNNAFRTILEMISTGTAQQNLSPILMGKYSIIVPHRNVLSLFSDLCNPILDEILLLYMKNKTLRHTRDLLLPKLISGKVDVSDLDIDTSILHD